MPTKGRPPRSDEAATKRLSIALTPKELEKVTEVAKKQDTDTTSFWRKEILKTADKIEKDDQSGKQAD